MSSYVQPHKEVTSGVDADQDALPGAATKIAIHDLDIIANNPDFAEIRVQDRDYAPFLSHCATLFIQCTQVGLSTVSLVAFLLKMFGPQKAGIIGAIYALWLKTSDLPYSGEGKNNTWRNLTFWKLIASYFPHTLVRTDRLLGKQYIFGVHPHGILSFCVQTGLATNTSAVGTMFPHLDIRVAVINSPLFMPVSREVAIGVGCISTDKPSVLRNLKLGRSVALVIGGADEALLAGSGAMRLVLKDRMGFVKVAVETGTPLVPVLAFGENELYNQVFSQKLRAMQQKMQKVMGFSMPLFYSKYLFRPYRRPLNTVVGGPVEVAQCSPEDPQFPNIVKETSTRYIDALRVLHATYAKIYGGKQDQTLEILTVKEARSVQLARTIRQQLSAKL